MIHERLQKLIDHLEWNQAQLAKAVVTSPSTVSRWFRGEMPPSKNSIRRIANATGANPEWIEFGAGPMLIEAKATGEATSNLIPECYEFGRKPFLTEKAFARDTPLSEEEITFYGGLDGVFATITEWLEEEKGADGMTALSFIMELQERFPDLREWVRKKRGSASQSENENAPEKRDQSAAA